MLRRGARRPRGAPSWRGWRWLAHQAPGSLSGGTYNDNDWDVVPMEKWTHSMCIQWLREEVKWKATDIEIANKVLITQDNPGDVLRLGDTSRVLEGVSLSGYVSLRARNERHPHTPGPYAEPLKRWAECVFRGEEKIQSLEEYNKMKNTCDRVMVLRYSELLTTEKNNQALQELCDGVLATELRLSQLRGEEKEIKVGDVSGDVEARVLPAHLAWPCFFAVKQKVGAQDTHVLLRRIRPPVENMETDAIEKFKHYDLSKVVLWLGAAGIGKSSYTSVIAEKLVRNMNSNGNPSLITFRIDAFLYHVTCPQPGSIRVETVPLRLVDDLIAISASIAKRNGVLLMELMEKDTCPPVECHMLSSSSVKDADEIFKEQMKSGNTSIYFISPYEMWEVRAAAKLLYHLHEGKRDSDLACDKFVDRAVKRYDEVGGLPRYIFQKDDVYVSRKDGIATHSSATDFLATLQKNRPLGLTSSAKFFIAPISLSSTSWCTTVESARIRFIFLSENCERQVIKHLSQSNPNKLRVMREQFGDWLTEEMLLLASLQQHMVDTDISMFKAEWYKSPSYGRPITSACKKDDTFVKSMQPCIRMKNVADPICTSPVNELEDLVLYRSTPNVNMTVADCFVVDKSNRRLWLFNNSLCEASANPFKISNLLEFAESMQVVKNNYTVHLCYVRSSHRGGDVGLHFTENGKKSKLPDDLKAIYRFYVVRIHYEGISRCVELPNESTINKSPESECCVERLIEFYYARCYESSEDNRKKELMNLSKKELVVLYLYIFPNMKQYKADRMTKKSLVDDIDAHLHSRRADYVSTRETH